MKKWILIDFIYLNTFFEITKFSKIQMTLLTLSKRRNWLKRIEVKNVFPKDTPPHPHLVTWHFPKSAINKKHFYDREMSSNSQQPLFFWIRTSTKSDPFIVCFTHHFILPYTTYLFANLKCFSSPTLRVLLLHGRGCRNGQLYLSHITQAWVLTKAKILLQNTQWKAYLKIRGIVKQGYYYATLTSNPHHLALVQVASTTQLAVTCCHELSVNFEQLSNCTPFICYLLSTSVQCKELLLPQ